MYRSAVQEELSHPLYPYQRLGCVRIVGVSMTTVLTKAFPQEKPPVPRAVPDKTRVLIVGGGFAGIAAAPALTSFVTLYARASFSSILSAGADGQAVVCPLLRGSSPTRGVAPKQHNKAIADQSPLLKLSL